MPGARIELAQRQAPRDFKSLASTYSATQAHPKLVGADSKTPAPLQNILALKPPLENIMLGIAGVNYYETDVATSKRFVRCVLKRLMIVVKRGD